MGPVWRWHKGSRTGHSRLPAPEPSASRLPRRIAVSVPQRPAVGPYSSATVPLRPQAEPLNLAALSNTAHFSVQLRIVDCFPTPVDLVVHEEEANLKHETYRCVRRIEG